LKSRRVPVLAGRYLSTDDARGDVENRLFTNPGTASFPEGLAAIRFERGVGPLPPPPVPVVRIAGHLHYYGYRLWHVVAIVGTCGSAGALAPGHPACRR
jgi:hypothetical protein